MKRFASNLAILLVLTVAITAVLAMLADAPQQAADDSEGSAGTSEAAGTLAEPAPDEGTKPAHLEADEDTAAAAADAPETAVAGAVAQASDVLADTGPIELLQWMIIGAGIVATGGMVRGAARDWANGDLTLF